MFYLGFCPDVLDTDFAVQKVLRPKLMHLQYVSTCIIFVELQNRILLILRYTMLACNCSKKISLVRIFLFHLYSMVYKVIVIKKRDLWQS